MGSCYKIAKSFKKETESSELSTAFFKCGNLCDYRLHTCEASPWLAIKNVRQSRGLKGGMRKKKMFESFYSSSESESNTH